jgi:hypothetical protein
MTIEAQIGAAIALLAVVLTGAQLFLDHLARSRQRDLDLTNWGMRVIALMAELESQCAPFADRLPFEPNVAEALSYRASALVDEGRLFFPNVEVSGDDRGYRVHLLDEVLRAFYVARILAMEGRSNGDILRCHAWSARTRFVRNLQHEVRGTLRKARQDHQGISIPSNPSDWGSPQYAPEWLRSRIASGAIPSDWKDGFVSRPAR